MGSTVSKKDYRTFGHFTTKTAFFKRVRQKVKVLPHPTASETYGFFQDFCGKNGLRKFVCLVLVVVLD